MPVILREGSRRTVRTALQPGFNILKRITINLFPADTAGRHCFDLPIAAGMLASMGVIPTDNIKNILILESQLDGHVNMVSVLSIVHLRTGSE
ncbi:MAG: magnesium chelatase domain-containing protein [Coprococcus sp.]